MLQRYNIVDSIVEISKSYNIESSNSTCYNFVGQFSSVAYYSITGRGPVCCKITKFFVEISESHRKLKYCDFPCWKLPAGSSLLSYLIILRTSLRYRKFVEPRTDTIGRFFEPRAKTIGHFVKLVIRTIQRFATSKVASQRGLHCVMIYWPYIVALWASPGRFRVGQVS